MSHALISCQTPGTKEQAFVYAMSAAAAVWRLARGCALGHLTSCSCAPPPRREPPAVTAALIQDQSGPFAMGPGLSESEAVEAAAMAFGAPAAMTRSTFKWGGCGDDVRTASRLAKRFLQGSSPSNGAQAKFLHAVNMHNNRAGRRVSEFPEEGVAPG